MWLCLISAEFSVTISFNNYKNFRGKRRCGGNDELLAKRNDSTEMARRRVIFSTNDLTLLLRYNRRQLTLIRWHGRSGIDSSQIRVEGTGMV